MRLRLINVLVCILVMLIVVGVADRIVTDLIRGELARAEAWTALATIALVGVTALAVWQTNLLLQGEEMRAQQRLAPYLTANFHTSEPQDGLVEILGFSIKNSGYGLAQNVSLNLEAYTTPYRQDETMAMRLRRAESDGDKLFKMNVQCEVIAANECPTIYVNEQGPLQPATVVARARLQYYDSFGNLYETIYDDWHEKRSRWVVPLNLRIKRTS